MLAEGPARRPLRKGRHRRYSEAVEPRPSIAIDRPLRPPLQPAVHPEDKRVVQQRRLIAVAAASADINHREIRGNPTG